MGHDDAAGDLPQPFEEHTIAAGGFEADGNGRGQPLEFAKHRGPRPFDGPRHDLAPPVIQDTEGRLSQVSIQTDVPHGKPPLGSSPVAGYATSGLLHRFTFPRELSSRRRTPRIVAEELSGASKRSKIIPMRTAARLQQRYDHRLRDLVHRTGDVTIATDLGVPRSTARGWLRMAPEVVVSLDVTHLSEPEVQHEILQLRRRVEKLAALLRLVLAVLRASGFTLSHERLPDGRAKLRILRAIEQARACIPLRALLRFLSVSQSRFHAWRRQDACALDDQSSCPRTAPHRLTPSEVQVIEEMVTAPEYRHVPTGTLAVRAQRLGRVWASPSTWYHLVRKFGWRRPRLRVHPAKPKVGLRTTRADEMWHIDTTVIRLLDGTRAYLHAVIDNFSRRILAWRVADTFAPGNSVAVLLEASRHTISSDTTPVVLADAGVENVNAQVDDLINRGVLRRLLALTELQFSNSMIEAWWRSLKHQWLFLHSLDSVTTLRRLVAFYVDEHNRVLPHSAFRGQTPDEMYFGTGDAVPADLTSRAAAARQARSEANRSAICETCPSLGAAA